ncbi:MAG: hypothetical protein WB759_10010, partial [Methanoregula sp.]
PGASPDEPASHGVCKSCYEQILTRYRLNIRKFLDMLDAPVLLVDNDVNVLAANTLAIEIIKKPVEQIRGIICGKVLECINASLPEGCGKTEFCPECTIRASVNETYTTGHPVTRRPAVVDRTVGGTREKMHFFISTRKNGDVVLLRLEPETGA